MTLKKKDTEKSVIKKKNVALSAAAAATSEKKVPLKNLNDSLKKKDTETSVIKKKNVALSAAAAATSEKKVPLKNLNDSLKKKVTVIDFDFNVDPLSQSKKEAIKTSFMGKENLALSAADTAVKAAKVRFIEELEKFVNLGTLRSLARATSKEVPSEYYLNIMLKAKRKDYKRTVINKENVGLSAKMPARVILKKAHFKNLNDFITCKKAFCKLFKEKAFFEWFKTFSANPLNFCFDRLSLYRLCSDHGIRPADLYLLLVEARLPTLKKCFGDETTKLLWKVILTHKERIKNTKFYTGPDTEVKKTRGLSFTSFIDGTEKCGYSYNDFGATDDLGIVIRRDMAMGREDIIEFKSLQEHFVKKDLFCELFRKNVFCELFAMYAQDPSNFDFNKLDVWSGPELFQRYKPTWEDVWVIMLDARFETLKKIFGFERAYFYREDLKLERFNMIHFDVPNSEKNMWF
uniref:Uncharacterized protein n=1 Tax=Aureoumbra lagunensis TaxID=44058 RepID=A0A7U0KSH7_9STRA|nr:hypothetical protein K4Z71_mgp22 [Aureoumbra lagunensis]QQW50404.1 hypothetical protein [Aureoumbra lagunensis]